MCGTVYHRIVYGLEGWNLFLSRFPFQIQHANRLGPVVLLRMNGGGFPAVADVA